MLNCVKKRGISGIGELLKFARLSYGATLDDISSRLKIQKKYLRYLENNEFCSIPDGIYREHYLKSYATYLNLDWNEVAEKYSHEQRCEDDLVTVVSTEKIRKLELWVTPRIIKNVCASCAIVACFAYLFFLGYTMIKPPDLTIQTPQDQALTTAERMTVRGQAGEQDVQVTINGEQVSKNQQGTFSQEVVLSRGVNVIRISAKKRFSRDTVVTRRVILEKNDAFASR